MVNKDSNGLNIPSININRASRIIDGDDDGITVIDICESEKQ
jgi:hypothetical protein